MSQPLLHAKISVTAPHIVTDDHGRQLWSYASGERYDVAEDLALEIIAAGHGVLVDVPEQSVNGVPASSAARAKLADRLARAVPVIVEPAPEPAPEVAAAPELPASPVEALP